MVFLSQHVRRVKAEAGEGEKVLSSGKSSISKKKAYKKKNSLGGFYFKMCKIKLPCRVLT